MVSGAIMSSVAGIENLVGSLLIWIASNSTYDTGRLAQPDVQLVSAAEITAEYYSDTPEQMPDSGIDPRIKALYTPLEGKYGTIYLKLTGDPDELLDDIAAQEILLHELVHHVQWQTGVADTWRCNNEGELEAYALGAEFLRQKSYRDHFLSRRAWAQIYSAC